MSKSEIAIRNGWFPRLLRALKLVEVSDDGQTTHVAGSDFIGTEPASQGYPAINSMSAMSAFPWVRACVEAISSDLTKVPLRVLRGRGRDAEPVEDHPILDLLDRPSSRVPGILLRRQLIVDLVLTGDAYLLIAGKGEPMALLRLHPERVKIIPTQDGQPSEYEFNGGGSTVRYGFDQVLHIRLASWQQTPAMLYGTGAIEALQHDLNTDLAAAKLAAESASTGLPTGIISPTEGDVWSRQQILRLREGFEKQLKSKSGTVILGAGVDYKQLSQTLRDMEYQNTRLLAREATLASFGVPPSRVGLPNANYATAMAQSRLYWEGLQGKAALIDSELTRLARMFPDSDDVRVVHDFSEVDALQESRTERVNRVQTWWLMGVDLAEAAALEGFDNLDRRDIDPEPEAEEVDEQTASLIRLMFDRDTVRRGLSDLPDPVQDGLRNKADDHNEQMAEEGKAEWRRTTAGVLAQVFERGLGAYEPHPESVRPSVNSAEQWAYARVNSWLYALRNDEYRSGKHDTDLLPEEHPMSTVEETARAVGDEDPTNFPADGDDETVSLGNSQWDVFDLDFAEMIKLKYPQIWRRGGNIKGNEQYRKLRPIAQGGGGVDTRSEEQAVRLREAWGARHSEDFRLAGVVAQMKWLVVGSRGERYMKDLIIDEMDRLDAEKAVKWLVPDGEPQTRDLETEEGRAAVWRGFIDRVHEPSERKIALTMRRYLRAQAARIAKRLAKEVGTKGITKAVDDRLLDRILDDAYEKQQLLGLFRPLYRDLIGNAFDEAQRTIPVDLTIDPDELDRQALAAVRTMSGTILQTTEKVVRDVVNKGLAEDWTLAEFQSALTVNKRFSPAEAMMIARTETTRHSNKAAIESFKKAEETGLKIEKMWLSARDGKVRDAHRPGTGLDGQTVPVGAKCSHQGHTTDHPGGFGVPAQDINCRCTVVAKVVN